jgi:O-antigen/teichoic acid export membrane protein
MVVSFAFVIPSHLATVLYAVGATQPILLMEKMRATMRLSLLAAIPMSVGLFLTAGILLNLFGGHYAEQAEWCLRILSLGVFPLIVKYHYVALLRVYNQLDRAVMLFLFGSALEIALVVIGIELGALTGLSIGWLTAVSVEAIFMYNRMSQKMSEQAAAVESST